MIMATVNPNGTSEPALFRRSTEVSARATRRRFTKEYKLRILLEAETAKRGELGALLRREGLHSSHLAIWRRQRDENYFSRPVQNAEASSQRIKQLERRLARSQRELEQARLIIDVQKKLSMLMGIELPTEINSENA